MNHDDDGERLIWAFLLGMVVALGLGLAAQYAGRPTEAEMYQFRDRLCSGYPSE